MWGITCNFWCSGEISRGCVPNHQISHDSTSTSMLVHSAVACAEASETMRLGKFCQAVCQPVQRHQHSGFRHVIKYVCQREPPHTHRRPYQAYANQHDSISTYCMISLSTHPLISTCPQWTDAAKTPYKFQHASPVPDKCLRDADLHTA